MCSYEFKTVWDLFISISQGWEVNKMLSFRFLSLHLQAHPCLQEWEGWLIFEYVLDDHTQVSYMLWLMVLTGKVHEKISSLLFHTWAFLLLSQVEAQTQPIVTILKLALLITLSLSWVNRRMMKSHSILSIVKALNLMKIWLHHSLLPSISNYYPQSQSYCNSIYCPVRKCPHIPF